MLICIKLLTINADPDELDLNLLLDIINQNTWGLRCVTEMILEIEDAAGDFTHDLTICDGSNATDDHLHIVQLANDLATLTSKLLNVNDEVCKNPVSMPGWDGSLKPSELCVETFTEELLKISELFEEILRQINRTTPIDICPILAMSKFAVSVQNFDEYMLTCSGVSQTVSNPKSTKKTLKI
uniref:Uncharacterized protein n=1 Tax=Glossina pallidipes TaxID=7398 RepID=A0A1A9ZB01_GLOPL